MSDDRYINGTCPMTCPNFKRQSESIAEYQRIEKTLQATITELTTKNNDMWSELSIAHVKTIKDRRVETMQATITELRDERNLAWGKGYAQGRDDAHTTITSLKAAIVANVHRTWRTKDTDEKCLTWFLKQYGPALKEQTIEPE